MRIYKKKSRLTEIEFIPFPKKKYNIIYADPPWGMRTVLGRDVKKKGGSQHYPVLSTPDLCRMPVRDIAADDSVCLLWAVDSMLPDALEVMKAWGFVFKSIAFTWIKETSTGKDFLGLGMWARKNPEICLLGTRGTPKRHARDVRQLQRHKIREHSRKPDAIRDEIVKLCGDLPRIELFCRYPADGWDVWGNQVDCSE